MQSLAQIYAALASYQYLILFPATVIEGPIVTIIAGFLVAQGLMSFFIVYPLVIVGDVAGDAIYYALGRWGRNFGQKLFRLPDEKLKALELHFQRHSGKTLLLGKASHGIGAAFLFAAGTALMPFRKFLLFNTIGSAPKSLILMLVGYFFGQSYVRIGKYFDYIAIFTLAIAIIILAGYLLIARRLRKKEKL
ncbi:DedA family protein [Candidatus Falkowbacteria bacterium]|nr:DedA family protein [Candidatus Falkowbacteria bacterium]